MRGHIASLIALVTLASCGDPAVLRAWLADWERARACMFTNPEYGPDSETAYVVSSFLKETSCTTERAQLIAVRDADRTSIPEWDDLRKDLEAVIRGGVDASGIDRIDARVAHLREAARLAPIARVRQQTPIPLAAAVPYHAPNEESWPGPGMLTIAVPSRAWSADADGDVLAINERGVAPINVKLPGDYWPSRAMDRGDTRVVTLKRKDNGGGFAVAHSGDRGRTWTVESVGDLPITRSSQNRETGTIYAIVESLGHAYVHRFDTVEPWALPARIEIPRFNDSSECHDDKVLYVLGDLGTRLLRVENSATVVDTGASSLELQACDRHSALLWSESAHVLIQCRPDRCSEVHRTTPNRAQRFESAATLREDGTWVLASVSGTFVGVWREGHDEPAFYQLRQAGPLVKLRAVNKTVELVMELDGKTHVVPLPRL